MVIYADIGNSNTKLCTFSDFSNPLIIKNREADEAFINGISSLIKDDGEIYAVSVSEDSLKRFSGISKSLNITLKVFDKASFPFESRYKNPLLLGADRIVTDYAALRLYGGGLIVTDLGTAATFDIMDKEGVHLGGAIMPGLDPYESALLSKARALPGGAARLMPEPTGITTEENLTSGLYYGFVGSVLHMTWIYKKKYPGFKAVLTGGDTELFKDEDIIDIFDRGLTLKGLDIIKKDFPESFRGY